MANEKLRIILDTNILISFLINKEYDKLDDKILSGEIILLFSKELLKEVITVIQRPKFQKIFSFEDVEILINFFLENALLIEIVSDIDLCRDKKDNFLLNLAADGKADFLITGDKDLLVLDPLGNTRIVTFSEFLKIKDR